MYCLKLFDIINKIGFARYTFIYLDGVVKHLDITSKSKELASFYNWYIWSFEEIGNNTFIKLLEPFKD